MNFKNHWFQEEEAIILCVMTLNLGFSSGNRTLNYQGATVNTLHVLRILRHNQTCRERKRRNDAMVILIESMQGARQYQHCFEFLMQCENCHTIHKFIYAMKYINNVWNFRNQNKQNVLMIRFSGKISSELTIQFR